MRNIVHLCDCMEFMKDLPDNAYDLAIVDPPYGINHSVIAGKQSGSQYGKAAAPKGRYKVKNWDSDIPDKAYFDEIFRVSVNQIIWGANNMSHMLPGGPGWIFWDKKTGTNGFSDGETAFTSFDKGLRKFVYVWNGMIQGNMRNKEARIHPTQKPVALYKWLLQNYAKPGQTIVDTHVGSGSIRIACHDLGFDFTGCEIDEDYWEAQEARFKTHQAQGRLFEPEEIRQPEQAELL